ncbi:MAG: transporter substrate-binding domain-containing protein [Pseudomonadota bacterium]
MRNSVLACGLSLSVFAGGVGLESRAQAQELACGGTYAVVLGDTLQNITDRVYGPDETYQKLYKANRAVVGPNPSLIEVGMVLNLPCPDDSAATASAAPATTPAQPQASGTAQTSGAVLFPQTDRPIRILTGTDWAPFQNQDQEQGGMITEIVAEGMRSAGGPESYKIDFINDYAAHLDTLIADGAYDLSFAWFRPNCDAPDRLSEDSRLRCTSLAWSDPLFEQIIGYFMRADDPNKPTVHSDLFGRTLCRPRGFDTFMMEDENLVEPNITLVRPISTIDCFELLLTGEVDAVVLASSVADDAISRLEAAGQIEDQPQLATIATMHAVTTINNPNAEQQLGVLNEGIRQLRENGKWFEIVQRHLVAHARNTAALRN